MKLITAEQMRGLEHETIQVRGIPGLALMEGGGAALAAVAREMVPTPASLGLLLGPGNNAGDGCVAARLLAQAGYDCTLYCLGDASKFGRSAAINWERLPTERITIVPWTAATVIDPQHVLLLDCLFGISVSGVIGEPYATVIAAANAGGIPILSCDLPSGLHADTGLPCGIAIRATRTVTFGLPKRGLLVGESADYVGALTIRDVGFPPDLIDAFVMPDYCNDPSTFAGALPQRSAAMHKGDCGRVLVIAGSSAMPGAGLLASRAALRAGAGSVMYALPQTIATRCALTTPEVMFTWLPDAATGHLHGDAFPALETAWCQASAMVLGPGLGANDAVAEVVRTIVRKNIPIPLVLDADALNAIANNPKILQQRSAPTILTPHPGEMARLCGLTTTHVQADRIGIARHFAQAHGVHVVLKGSRTVIAHPDGDTFINPTGNPAMATAGAGDVLAGVIAGLLAQGMPVAPAIRAAVYLHGAAGDLWANIHGGVGLLASDLIDSLPQARKAILKDA